MKPLKILGMELGIEYAFTEWQLLLANFPSFSWASSLSLLSPDPLGHLVMCRSTGLIKIKKRSHWEGLVM